MEGADFCPKGLVGELDSVPQRLKKASPIPAPCPRIHLMTMLILAEKQPEKTEDKMTSKKKAQTFHTDDPDLGSAFKARSGW